MLLYLLYLCQQGGKDLLGPFWISKPIYFYKHVRYRSFALILMQLLQEPASGMRHITQRLRTITQNLRQLQMLDIHL